MNTLDRLIGDWLYATFKIDISSANRNAKRYDRKIAKSGRGL